MKGISSSRRFFLLENISDNKVSDCQFFPQLRGRKIEMNLILDCNQENECLPHKVSYIYEGGVFWLFDRDLVIKELFTPFHCS